MNSGTLRTRGIAPWASQRPSSRSGIRAEGRARTGLRISHLVTAAVFLGQLFVVFAAEAQAGNLDFAEFAQALRAYQEKPSPETAAGVRALLPAEGPIKFDDSPQSRSAREELEDALPVLEEQVQALDRDAIRLGLNLRALADGPILQSLDVILGRLITTDARVFLQELLRWRTQLPLRTLGQIVGTLGKEYAEEDRAAACAEIERRIDALLAVNEAALTQARDQCVNELRQRRPRCG